MQDHDFRRIASWKGPQGSSGPTLLGRILSKSLLFTVILKSVKDLGNFCFPRTDLCWIYVIQDG